MSNKPKIYVTDRETGVKFLITDVNKVEKTVTMERLSDGQLCQFNLSGVTKDVYIIETVQEPEEEPTTPEVVAENTTVVVESTTEPDVVEPVETTQETVTQAEAPISNSKMTRKQAKVVIDAMKDEARPWLSRMVEMEAQLLELNGGMGEAKKLGLAIKRLDDWVEE